jgi:hypothetical protein
VKPSVLDKTRFLNVDLIIYSRSDLAPLVSAMGTRVIVLYVGSENRKYKACLEISGMPTSPEAAIKGFCRLISGLPRPYRRLWDEAKVRTFDIGIKSGPPNSYYWFAIEPESLKMAARVNAQIAVTAYGKLRMARFPRKST